MNEEKKERKPLKPDQIAAVEAIAPMLNETARHVMTALMSLNAMTYDDRLVKILRSKLDFNAKQMIYFLEEHK